jgi:hypothetical protein
MAKVEWTPATRKVIKIWKLRGGHVTPSRTGAAYAPFAYFANPQRNPSPISAAGGGPSGWTGSGWRGRLVTQLPTSPSPTSTNDLGAEAIDTVVSYRRLGVLGADR